MKEKRQAKIMEIIGREVITTQGDLAEALREEGFEVTQATISRDIKELGLIKVPLGEGLYRYAPPGESTYPLRFRRIFREAVLSFDHSDNLVVVKTISGMAQGVASVIDNSHIPGIIGTVAGDDTVLVVVKPREEVAQVLAQFQHLLE